MSLGFAFSPCPNDTFAFHALVHRLVPGPAVTPLLEDVETLNARAERGDAEVTKISVAAYPRIREGYALLRAGGAAGYGVGPIVVARRPGRVCGRIAVPGLRTTAALLLRMLGEFETVPLRFDRIEDAVLSGDVECGVLIHEGRFTYKAKGLVLLKDLGALWEERTQLPVPLGAVAIRRDLAPLWARPLDEAIRASVAYARRSPAASSAYVALHAREMGPDVIRRHIDLYVNDYTLDLDERAVHRMLEQAPERVSRLPVFAD
ncbi:MAG: 1,4-dihydroxy-6-naphthoate synthase [Planctomycetaceae bacterium]